MILLQFLGAELADACQRANIPIHPVPGPSAVISALCISGFSSSSFSFHGFVPVKGKERSEKLLRIASSPDTTVFFEAPHRIKETFLDLSRDFEQGQRQCICCREITKLHEEFVRGTVDSCYIWLENFKEDKVTYCFIFTPESFFFHISHYIGQRAHSRRIYNCYGANGTRV